jgi:hypothetical protein
MNKKDGGDAFPRQDYTIPGMTLRDYFAAQAMAGIAARGESKSADQARRAYEIADAMIAERQGGYI